MSKKLIQAAAGAGGEPVYVEDVFSTYLYTGADANETVTNGIDLSGEGGLVWTKVRTGTSSHLLFDTERGTGKYLQSNSDAAEATYNPYLSSFNSDGFTTFAFAPSDYVSWSFRKQAGFFDVVSYTGNGTARSISHNLNASVGLLVVKRVDTGGNWFVLDVGTGKRGYFDYIDSAFSTANGTFFGDGSTYQAPTSTEFYLSGNGNVNQNNGQYVAYLFAAGTDSGSQIFGEDSDKAIIECGSFTTDSNAEFYENLGWEPQWLLIKNTAAYGNWNILDNMRGLYGVGTANGKYLRADNSNAEGNLSSTDSEYINATGFGANGNGVTGSANAEFIYIAIRRPMKTPEAATEVFAPALGDATAPDFESGFPVDFAITGERSGSDKFYVTSRLTGGSYMNSTSTGNEASAASIFTWDYMDGVFSNSLGSTYVSWMFKRATGFMDVVAYEGSSTLFQTYNHNLGVTPELVIVKCRTATTEATHDADWFVLSKGPAASGSGSGYRFNGGLNLADAASTDSVWAGMTDATFTPFYASAKSGPGGIAGQISGEKYIACLFASLDGISKVGTFTHTNGSDTNVDCGFSSGARFVLIKRTDATDGWQVYDTERGIVAGSDPVLQLNSTAAEFSQDLMDPYSSGFTITGTKTSGTYIFLAIA